MKKILHRNKNFKNIFNNCSAFLLFLIILLYNEIGKGDGK